MSKEKEGCTISADEIKRVKGLGFLNNKGTNKFNARVITRNGRITAEEAQAISKAASLYGDGHMAMTTRLTIEVTGVDYENIEAFRACVGEAGLETGGTGAKVRPVVSCKGTTCQYGLYDTFALSNEIHEKFYKGYHGVALPHKFKIAVGGCPNNCVKPNLNDVGVMGSRIVKYDEEKCKGCKKCKIEERCPMHAAKVVDGKLTVDMENCTHCGLCYQRCPFECSEECTNGWRIYVGGRWGKRVSHAKLLDKFFTDKQEVLDTIEKVILFFRSEGNAGERLAETIERIGFDKAQEMILGDDLLKRKDEILAD